MRLKYPYIDRARCVRCERCWAAEKCDDQAFSAPEGEIGQPGVDYAKCRKCGTCELACRQGAVRMV